MLVLTRKPNESIIIDVPRQRPIEVMICYIGAGKVRVGIEASNDVVIARKEVYFDKGSDNDAQA